MKKKRKVKYILCGISIVLVYYIICNTFFITAQVYTYKAFDPYISDLQTLYWNRMLVVSDVNYRAENSKLMRYFQIPKTIKRLSKEDYKKVRALLKDLEGKDSELTRQQCLMGTPPSFTCLLGEINHYVIGDAYGTAEASKIVLILYLYEKGLPSLLQ